MKKRSGIATLLFTSVLLTAALVMTMASYKGLIYQIKRAQNEVEARKLHWRGEGGLECVYSYAKQDPDPSNHKIDNTNVGTIQTNCKDHMKLNQLSFAPYPDAPNPSPEDIVISSIPSSRFNEIKVSKAVNQSTSSVSASTSGAMKSTANLFFNTSMSFYTPDPGKETPEGFECTIIRHKGTFTTRGAMDNKGLQDGRKPYADFNSTKNCLTSHRSPWGKEDIKKDKDLNPFEEFFGVKRENHNQVRSKFDYIVEGGGTECGKRVEAKLIEHKASNPGKQVKIWVDGHCEIADPYTKDIALESQNTEGLLLLVHDGVFSMNSAGNSKDKDGKPIPNDIKGLVFHFNDKYVAAKNDWNGMKNSGHLFHSSHNFPLDERKKTSFFHRGSISLTGGFYIDDLKNNAMFDNSLAFHFNSDVLGKLKSSFSSSGELKWQKGSWYAN